MESAVMPGSGGDVLLFGIQYLRAIAALMVVVHHALHRLQTYGDGGFSGSFDFLVGGVDVFFVISGFIMYYITSTRTIGPLDFLKSRIIRIVPIYWFWLAVFILLYPETTTLLHSIKSFLFIPAYHPQYEIKDWFIWPPLIQGWTLNYEMFFYLLFAIAIWSRKRLLVISILIALLVSVRYVFPPQSAPLLTYTSPQILEFLAGCLIARFYLSAVHVPAIAGWIILVVGALLFVVFEFAPVPTDYFSGFWILNRGLPATLIVFAVAIVERTRPLPEWRFPGLIAASSYTLYLCHVFFLEWISQYWKQLGLDKLVPDFVMLVVLVLACTVIGVLMYLLIERPVIRMLRGRRNTPSSA